MKIGKSARNKGEKYQSDIAKYLGMRNFWPMPGIDISDGKLWGISTKQIEAYPETIEAILEEAESQTRKKLPGGIGIAIIGKPGRKRTPVLDLCFMRVSTYKWILFQLKKLELISEGIGLDAPKLY